MEGWVIIPALAVVALLTLHFWAGWRFRRSIYDLRAQLAQGRALQSRRARDDLPGPVRAFALRGLAGAAPGGRVVQLRQDAEMLLKPGAEWQPIVARQTIALTEAGFVWEAEGGRGPLPVFRVLDAYVAGCGQLRVGLFGSIPVARAVGGAMDRGEAMRYLAELPWVPDAILLNRDIFWRVLESGEIEARLKLAPRDAVVRFTRNRAGDLVEMNADERPATGPDGAVELRAWRGRFSDYETIGGRRIPKRGEVGHVIAGDYAPYWRGEVTIYGID